MAAFPRDGCRDAGLRLRMAWLWIQRFRARNALAVAEGELGFLAWEQVDFFDEELAAEVRKIQEFEDTQASLLNTSAEIAERKASLDAQLAREKALHDAAQATLDEERAPLLIQLQEGEELRRLKLEAVDRFSRAVDEMDGDMRRLEKEVEEHSRTIMLSRHPPVAVRNAAIHAKEALLRIAVERKHVLASQASASQEAAAIEARFAHLRVELKRIDSAAAEAHEAFAAATHRLTGERRLLERRKKKSSSDMSHLDSKKQRPYRSIGACLADHGIAPRNQPQVLQKVLTLRERNHLLTQSLADLQAAAAATPAGTLVAFYALVACILLLLAALAVHLR